jgi:hypothetical protein
LTGLRANMRLLAEAGNERGRDPRREISQAVSETVGYCWRIRQTRTFAGKSVRSMTPNWTKTGLLP